MSLCLVALVVLGVLGIFSAKYRRWAREAFKCVTRRLVLRPCDTGFDQAVKAKVVSTFSSRPALARFAHKYFEPISWIFTILMFVSIIYSAMSVYNLAVYGTCDPVSGQCIFNPGLPACGNPVCIGVDCTCPTGQCQDALCTSCSENLTSN